MLKITCTHDNIKTVHKELNQPTTKENEREVTSMKQNTTYNRATQYLNKIFKLINSEYFDNELEMPTITIQSTVGAYGHVTTSKVWKTETGTESYELNIGADYLSRPIENVVATMIHEAVHLYCLQNGIKDTSNRGVYHNKRFKEIAESKGHLQIDKHEKYGWTITSPTEDTIDFCIANGLTEILVCRNTGYTFVGIGTGKAGNAGKATPTAPKKSSSIKWVCPCCNTIIRSTKIVNVICGDCGEQFVRA